MRKIFFSLLLMAASFTAQAQRQTINFNGNWQIRYPAEAVQYPNQTKTVTLPHAWNEDWAYRVNIAQLPDDTCRYTKRFNVPADWQGKHIFIEFEGARQSAEVFLNGHRLGLHQNGVMAFGFELTPFIKAGEENVLEVLTDNDWAYKERNADGSPLLVEKGATESKDGNNLPNNRLAPTSFQWNNKNFNMNMGGLPKNVKLHVTGDVYQTLPLYSNLGTTGVYVYGTDYDIPGKKVTANIESQVCNASKQSKNVTLNVEILDNDGRQVARFKGKPQTIKGGQTAVLKASQPLSNVHFWSWGYGYLYTVKTSLDIKGSNDKDIVSTITGFRKTKFGEGKIWLNDRCFMVHGYAQRTSNEWPSVGIDVPAWLSDYSNDLVVKSGGNTVRWMHVTPSKQDGIVRPCRPHPGHAGRRRRERRDRTPLDTAHRTHARRYHIQPQQSVNPLL